MHHSLFAFITHVNGKQGMMHLRIGEPSDIYFSNNPGEGIQQRKLPFTLSLQKFDIHLYEGTNNIKDYSYKTEYDHQKISKLLIGTLEQLPVSALLVK